MITSVIMASCVGSAPRELDELLVRDSLYLDPTTSPPYSGAVVRSQPDDDNAPQLEGRLRDGAWEGEFTVYHMNGRVRYKGAFLAGERCGPWIEDADSMPPINLYDEIAQEIASMAIYPPC